MNEEILIVDDTPESRRNLGSLRSGGLVGGRHQLMAAMLGLAALCGGAARDVITPFDRLPDLTPKKPREKTAADFARIEAARLKRERKAAKRSARTTTPNK